MNSASAWRSSVGSTIRKRSRRRLTALSVAMSTLLLGLVWFAAPAFSTAMGDTSATPVVRVMAVSILINGIVAAPAALMQRNFRQSRRMAIDQVNTWLGAGRVTGPGRLRTRRDEPRYRSDRRQRRVGPPIHRVVATPIPIRISPRYCSSAPAVWIAARWR